MEEKNMSVDTRGTWKSEEEERDVKGEPGLSVSKQIFNCTSKVVKGSWEQNESTDGSVRVIQGLFSKWICMEAYSYFLIFVRSFGWISKIDWAWICCIAFKIGVCTVWTGHSDPLGSWENHQPYPCDKYHPYWAAAGHCFPCSWTAQRDCYCLPG